MSEGSGRVRERLTSLVSIRKAISILVLVVLVASGPATASSIDSAHAHVMSSTSQTPLEGDQPRRIETIPESGLLRSEGAVHTPTRFVSPSTRARAATATAGTTPPDASTANETINRSTANETTIVTVGEKSARSLGTATSSTIDATYTINRTPATLGRVTISYELRPPSNLVDFTLYLRPHQTVTSATGFTNTQGNQWTWSDATGISTPTLTIRADANTTAFDGYDTVDTAEWAFLDNSIVIERGFSYRYTGSEPTYRADMNLVQRGYITDYNGMAYIGAHSTESYEGQQSFTFVSPANETAVEPGAVLRALDTIGRDLRLGGLDHEVTVFAIPEPIRAGGSAGDDEFWVSAYLGLTDGTKGSVYYHEYVHTRQSFADRDGLFETNSYWFIEASAEFYQHYLAYTRGEITDDALRDALVASQDRGVILTSVSPRAAGPAYTKGAHVLAALDLKIRNATGGQKTLAHVFARLNQRPQADFSAFKTIVATVAKQSFDGWLNTYVAGPSIPSLPQDLSAAYAATESTNRSPTAIVGPDRTVTASRTVELDAGDSSDPDGDTLRYAWTQTAGPSVSLTGADSATPTFTAPAVESRTTLTFEVVVRDGVGGSATDTVVITVAPATDTGPPDLTGDGTPAMDPDGDARYEDINGDGSFNVIDVSTFLSRFDDIRPANRSAVDFNGDGSINIVDVAILLEET